MGHHYIPQRYLKNFEVPQSDGSIWMFDKVSKRGKQVRIKAIAQETDFYEPEIEVALNEAVEKPANPVIQKLLAGEWLIQAVGLIARHVSRQINRSKGGRLSSQSHQAILLKYGSRFSSIFCIHAASS
jgi:hypothetical protein